MKVSTVPIKNVGKVVNQQMRGGVKVTLMMTDWRRGFVLMPGGHESRVPPLLLRQQPFDRELEIIQIERFGNIFVGSQEHTF